LWTFTSQEKRRQGGLRPIKRRTKQRKAFPNLKGEESKHCEPRQPQAGLMKLWGKPKSERGDTAKFKKREELMLTAPKGGLAWPNVRHNREGPERGVEVQTPSTIR